MALVLRDDRGEDDARDLRVDGDGEFDAAGTRRSGRTRRAHVDDRADRTDSTGLTSRLDRLDRTVGPAGRAGRDAPTDRDHVPDQRGGDGHGARALRVSRPVRPGQERHAGPFVPMRTRTHGGVAGRTTVVGPVVRPMVRSTVGIEAGPSPLKVVVPLRRRTARLVAIGFAVVFVLMLGAAAFETQLAQRQVKLDKIDREINTATDDYNRLRRERAELQSPERLATEATKLGMQPSDSTDFVTIDPSIVAEIQRSAGGVFDTNATVLSPLDEFTRVKSIIGTGP